MWLARRTRVTAVRHGGSRFVARHTAEGGREDSTRVTCGHVADLNPLRSHCMEWWSTVWHKVGWCGVVWNSGRDGVRAGVRYRVE